MFKELMKLFHIEFDDFGAYMERLEEISEFPVPVISDPVSRADGEMLDYWGNKMCKAGNPCRIMGAGF